MKRPARSLIVAAAISGLLSGAALRDQARADGTNAPGITTNKTTAGKAAKARTPKVQGCAGQNDCKGLGGCKTDDHACKFKNDCKGKGGCSITEKDIKDWQAKHKAKT